MHIIWLGTETQGASGDIHVPDTGAKQARVQCIASQQTKLLGGLFSADRLSPVIKILHAEGEDLV